MKILSRLVRREAMACKHIVILDIQVKPSVHVSEECRRHGLAPSVFIADGLVGGQRAAKGRAAIQAEFFGLRSNDH